MDNAMSLSDIAAVTRDSDGWGSGGGCGSYLLTSSGSILDRRITWSKPGRKC